MAKIVLIAMLLSACGVVQNGEGGRIIYLGAANARDHYSVPDKTDIVSREIDTIGLWVELGPSDDVNGVGLGYRRRLLMVTPIDCRVVFRVESEPQLREAVALTRDLVEGGKPLCIVQK